MRIKSIKDCKGLAGKKVLLRADLNVPVVNGEIVDEYKIIKQLPTIHFLLRNKCRIIILTHFGRPQTGAYSRKFSIRIIAKKLSKILDKKVDFAGQYDFLSLGTKVSRLKPGEILMLENIRFEKGEETNSRFLAKQLARLADVYVNDAFGVSHRKHASLSAIKKYLPSYAGLLVENEVKNLDRGLNPLKPLILIVGGVKLETKIPLIEKFQNKAWRILVGGALANNFLAAHKYEIGKSVVSKQGIKAAKKYKDKNILLPLDVIVSSSRSGEGARVKKVSEVGKSDYIFDIGPKTIQFYLSFIKRAQTIIWNGPMGFFEIKEFKHGTKAIARAVGTRATGRAFGIVGGGETIEALKQTKMLNHVDWVSTGGGATLSFLGGEKMPGLVGLVFDK